MRTLVTLAFLASLSGLAWLVQSQERLPPQLKNGREREPPTAGPSPIARTAREESVGEGEVLRIDTNLVTVPASVMDLQGRYVIDLRSEDFRIFEDGVEQRLSFFAPVEEPFTILMLLDVSGSMTRRLEDLVRAANAFVGQLRPDDRLSAIAFADFPWVILPTTKVSELRSGIKLKQRSDQQGTMLYDAVEFAFNRAKKIRGRKAIVFFSDGFGSGISATARGNLRAAEEMDALIYTVQFGTPPKKPPRYLNEKYYLQRIDEANFYMRDLARKGGGRSYHIDDLSSLEMTFGRVAEELRRHYSLGYYPRTPLEEGQRRAIKVKIDRPDLVVHARDSYVVDKDRVKGKTGAPR